MENEAEAVRCLSARQNIL